MAGIHRRTTTSRSSTAQESHPTIQVLQDWVISILEPMSQKGNGYNVVLDATIDAHPSNAMNTTLLPPPHPLTNDVPLPPPSLPVPDKSNLEEPGEHAPIANQGALDQSEDQSRVDTWPNLHLLKDPHPKEHAKINAPHHTRACPRARITLHVSSNHP